MNNKITENFNMFLYTVCPRIFYTYGKNCNSNILDKSLHPVNLQISLNILPNVDQYSWTHCMYL